MRAADPEPTFEVRDSKDRTVLIGDIASVDDISAAILDTAVERTLDHLALPARASPRSPAHAPMPHAA